MRQLVVRFLRDESGHALEYALLISGIALAIIPATNVVGDKLAAVFETLNKALR